MMRQHDLSKKNYSPTNLISPILRLIFPCSPFSSMDFTSFSSSHILSYDEGILFVFAFGGREVDANWCIRGGGLQRLYYTSSVRF